MNSENNIIEFPINNHPDSLLTHPPTDNLLNPQSLAFKRTHSELNEQETQKGRDSYSIVKASFNHAKPHYSLGKAFAKKGEWSRAISSYRHALDLDSNSAEIYQSLGDALVKNGELDEAVIIYQKAIEIQPDLWEVHHNLGDFWQGQGRLDEAVAAYRLAIAFNPDFSWSHNNLGDVLIKQEMWEEAVSAYRSAIGLNPDFHWSHYNLADALVKLEKWEDAIASYRSAIQLKSDLPLVHEKLGEALQNQIQFYSEEAISLYRQAIQQNPDDIELYHKALEIQPNDPELYLGLGNALARQGDRDEAIVFYRIGLQIDPDNTPIHRQLARLSPPKPQSGSRLLSYVDAYETWIADNEPTASEYITQTEISKTLTYRPLISIITPVYNTPPEVLWKTIQSVAEQTYDNWQLCLVDGNSTRSGVKKVLEEWSFKDQRIQVKFLEHNLGISANSNEALAMAKGEFIALLDHDDELAPFAIFEIVNFINHNLDCDVIYSDEDKISIDGHRHTPFFKPDWSPELLRSYMYIGHLTVYRRKLVDSVGGFRSEFDFSQDYDLAWRVTEITQNICHIPKVLYHWRVIPGSAAAGDKDFARISNLAALGAAIKRQGYQAEILEYPTANRVKFTLETFPLVSIVIPTDNRKTLFNCLNSLIEKTSYPSCEILVVTNSNLAREIGQKYSNNCQIKTVLFNEKFNFSAKCNRGVDAAQGKYVLILNDDVRVIDDNWIETLIEQMQDESVGAVSPKLLYETGLVQYAGMVTGVRGFVGTAFHQAPHDSTTYFNFVQSTRTVSILSGACCLIKKDVYQQLGGFDEINTPIMGSDVDLSCKIREQGLRIVYTPFATLTHLGHVSLDEMEKQKGKSSHSDKSDLYLLSRWGKYLSYDPYYPENMRDLIYRDSPTKYRMYASNKTQVRTSKSDILLVTHDLSCSGAPMMLRTLANYLKQDGYFVTIISPVAGALLEEYRKLNIPVIIDSLIFEAPDVLGTLLRNYDTVIANTIVSWPLVLAAKAMGKPTIWMIHEGNYGQAMTETNAGIQQALEDADTVVFASRDTESKYHKFAKRQNYAMVHYGIPIINNHSSTVKLGPRNKMRVMQVGSIESRKGQDITVKAVQSLPPDLHDAFEFYFVGRKHDVNYYNELVAQTAEFKNVHWVGEVSPNEALGYISESDVIVCASRDESLPVFILEAMSLGKTVVSTIVAGVPEAIDHGVNGLLFEQDDHNGLVANLIDLYGDRTLIQLLGDAARCKFEKHFSVERYGKDIVSLINKIPSDCAEASNIQMNNNKSGVQPLVRIKPSWKTSYYQKSQILIDKQAAEIQDLTAAYQNLLEDREKAQLIMDHKAAEIQDLTAAYQNLLEDREKAQLIMDHQAAEIQDLTSAYQNLLEDREKAQLIMDHQAAEIQNLTLAYQNLLEDREKAQLIMDHQAAEIQDLTSAYQNLLEDREKAQLIMDHQAAEIQNLNMVYKELSHQNQ